MPRNEYSNIIYSSAETTTVRLGKIRDSRFCFGWLLAAVSGATFSTVAPTFETWRISSNQYESTPTPLTLYPFAT